MSDFSNASILRLARLAVERLGVALPEKGAEGGGERDPRVPLESKRALLGKIFAEHGALGLLSISDVVAVGPDDAISAALRPSRDMDDLLERWRRLEAYVHSRHRLTVTRGGNAGSPWAILRHHSVVADEPPLAIESLLVAGALTGIAETIGVAGVRVSLGNVKGGGPAIERVDGRSRGELEVEAWSPAEWTLSWLPGAPAAAARPELTGSLEEQVRQLVRSDPARRWSVEALAAVLGLSARTFQRRLAEMDMRCSDLIAAERIACAAAMLIETHYGAAEIGFACGFSDQPHFSRVFRQGTLLTPKAYRGEFGLQEAGGMRP